MKSKIGGKVLDVTYSLRTSFEVKMSRVKVTRAYNTQRRKCDIIVKGRDLRLQLF